MSGVEFVTHGHLGGYVKSTSEYPHGDPWTWCPAVWDWAIATFRPRTMVDVGCGEGHTIKYFLERDVSAIGIDGCASAREAAVVEPERIVLHDFARGPLAIDPEIDLIWSCEFVEHVEERYAYNFLSIFAFARKAVMMTHAFPGQGGHHHVNCRSTDYWVCTMFHRGFMLSLDLTTASRALAPATHWGRSGLVFVPV
jgi:cyclopropane fatty-acyl-phospholipid synthase-like methyltransferase